MTTVLVVAQIDERGNVENDACTTDKLDHGLFV